MVDRFIGKLSSITTLKDCMKLVRLFEVERYTDPKICALLPINTLMNKLSKNWCIIDKLSIGKLCRWFATYTIKPPLLELLDLFTKYWLYPGILNNCSSPSESHVSQIEIIEIGILIDLRKSKSRLKFLRILLMLMEISDKLSMLHGLNSVISFSILVGLVKVESVGHSTCFKSLWNILMHSGSSSL